MMKTTPKAITPPAAIGAYSHVLSLEPESILISRSELSTSVSTETMALAVGASLSTIRGDGGLSVGEEDSKADGGAVGVGDGRTDTEG